ncbi:DNA-3-methyladenine glycosylase I [Trueperella pecoris]|uniref:DNA-3-methyladenine glycosylase I n=1 Tax=Trueperella pecoris TaxID=2733571 RepID=A0A7M1QWC5_9ACTO|nr:DNA-3-methyladenine glycosylase I [Trueperella pecoris]QOQ39141.1 DNA-3-methyladenine glycosylase I [Trueperella pecoris]QOR46228.1 DNA-3-methyladenine glycosylase I [Trueperella pecoris]QTG76053.1 DNA-3-methyladenine glycosylase I [Trueperella pecoris]
MNNIHRPQWASSDLLRAYYDDEWGFPVRDSAAVYERIVLEGFQAGLSWETVLRKREALREAFAHFEPRTVAAFTDDDVARLLADPRLIRNEKKIRAAMTNAQAVVRMEDAGESLAELVWSFAPDDSYGEGPQASRSPESLALAKELKRRGFTFVGPVTMFALMQAIGIYAHRL